MMSLTSRQIIGLDPIPMNLHGCHNRKPLQGRVLVQEGWALAYPVIGSPERIAIMRERDDPMSKDCQYTLRNQGDPECAGCRWRAGA